MSKYQPSGDPCAKYPTTEVMLLWGFSIQHEKLLTLLGLGLIKINNVSANFNSPRPSLILNN